MRTNYVPKHSRDHADSECVSYVGVDGKGTEFIGDKQINLLTHSQTYKHATLHINATSEVDMMTP